MWGFLSAVLPRPIGAVRMIMAKRCSRGKILPEMAETLKGLKGRFILSLNDVQGVRETFSGFKIETVDCRYSIAGGKGKAVKEVIISG